MNAFIHPEAKIGKNVIIEPFAYIDAGVEIGDNCHICTHAVVYRNSRLGAGCKLFPGAVVGAVPQDLKFSGEETFVEIGDGTVLRECATVHRGTASKGKTVVGAGCLIMAYCHVAHDCRLGDNIIMSNAVQLAGEVEVDDFAIIGGGSLVHQFTHIGAHSMIQGGTKVNKDVPPFVMAAHDPIAFVGINTVGLRRRGFENEKINEIHEIYRQLFLSGENFSSAVKTISEKFAETNEKNLILDFVKNSPRGIIKGR